LKKSKISLFEFSSQFHFGTHIPPPSHTHTSPHQIITSTRHQSSASWQSLSRHHSELSITSSHQHIITVTHCHRINDITVQHHHTITSSHRHIVTVTSTLHHHITSSHRPTPSQSSSLNHHTTTSSHRHINDITAIHSLLSYLHLALDGTLVLDLPKSNAKMELPRYLIPNSKLVVPKSVY
jgi:hypothetical protein